MIRISRVRSSVAAAVLLSSAVTYAGGIVSSCDEASLQTALFGGGLVEFNCDGTIVLSTTLVISANTTIDASSNAVAISGNQAVRIFDVQPGQELELIHVSLIDGLGAGMNGITNAAGADGVGGAVYVNAGTVRLAGCELAGNIAQGGRGGDESAPGVAGPGGRGFGGAVFSTNGSVYVSNSIFRLNRANGGAGGIGSTTVAGGESRGGAILTYGGNLEIVDSTFDANISHAGNGTRLGSPDHASAAAHGGAIFSDVTSMLLARTLFVCNTAKVDNMQTGTGGAVRHSRETLSIQDCEFENNEAYGGFGLVFAIIGGFAGGPGYGGAIYLQSSTGTISRSSFSGNFARAGDRGADMPTQTAGAGGGIFSDVSDLAVENLTFANNTAMGGQGTFRGQGNGAGLYVNAGTASVSYCTFSGNRAYKGDNPPSTFTGNGGAVYSASASVFLNASLMADSVLSSNAFGVIQDLGYNLSSDASLSCTNTGSATNTIPVLGPLDNYGGPTKTMPLLSGSPAIDRGPTVATVPVDQRGRLRPYHGTNDVGAFESSEPFVIRGAIFGPHAYPGMPVACGGSNIVTDASRAYSFEGLSNQTCVIIPQDVNYVYVPTSHVFSVGPDRVGADFKAYRLATTVIEKAPSNGVSAVFAGNIGQIAEFQWSTNLNNWTTIGSYPLTTNRIVSILLAATNRVSFYRNQLGP